MTLLIIYYILFPSINKYINKRQYCTTRTSYPVYEVVATMPLKDRLSTILHIHTANEPVQNPSAFHSQPNVNTFSPPQTPASASSIVSDPTSSPATLKTSSWVKSSPNTAQSSRQNSGVTPNSDGIKRNEHDNTMIVSKDKASRLASRLSALPKKMLRHKSPLPTNENQANPELTRLSEKYKDAIQYKFHHFQNNLAMNDNSGDKEQHAIQAMSRNGNYNFNPQTTMNFDAPNPIPTTFNRPNPRNLGFKNHKHTRSVHEPTTLTIRSTPLVIAQPKPQRPVTYHQASTRPPLLYAPQSEFNAGPHPGQLYDPFSREPSPNPSPPPSSVLECWEDDPPHVQKRLQTRHWESLFGNYSWASATSRRQRIVTSGLGLDKRCKPSDCGGISPRSKTPPWKFKDDRDSFWVRESEYERIMKRPRSVDVNLQPSDSRQAKELTEKMARMRMKKADK